MSLAAVTVSLMEIAAARLKWAGVDLGGTEGTIKLTGSFKKSDIKADQYGDTVLNRKVSGLEIKIETILTQVKSKAEWKVVFPNARLITAGNGAVYFESAIGQQDSDLAQPLLIHPLTIDDGNLDFDHLIYKAVPESISEIVFGPTKQQGLKIVWHVLPDFTTAPPRFWFHGDPANGIVAASAGSPVYTGTGNGTLTAVAVNNLNTKTETITVKVVGVPGANSSNWFVSGSVSGALGEFNVSGSGGSTNFSCAQISFTITDGSTDFVLNDQFTIATVASNYA